MSYLKKENIKCGEGSTKIIFYYYYYYIIININVF